MHVELMMRAPKTKEPAKLLSLPTAKFSLGDMSYSKFYADLMPELDIVRFGRRTFVTSDSVDRVIERHRVRSAAEQAAAEQAGAEQAGAEQAAAEHHRRDANGKARYAPVVKIPHKVKRDRFQRDAPEAVDRLLTKGGRRS
jgi:hypothetical protein